MSRITDSEQNSGKSHVPSPDEIWKILKEVSLSQKEADRRMRASDRQLRASREEADRRMRASREEADRRMRASREETDRHLRELSRMIKESKREADRRIQETWRQINKLDGKYGNLWGDLVEALIQGNLIEALNRAGLDLKKTIPNYTGRLNSRIREYDLIALNGREIVVVEAKSTLEQKKADKFLEVMAEFKEYCPEFSHLVVYAGMASLRASAEAVKYVIDKGMFMILVKGENAVLLNPEGSKPRVF